MARRLLEYRSPLAWAATVFWVAVAILAVPPIFTAHADPRVLVMTETRIELRATKEGQRVHVRGALRDDLGNPVPDATVVLRVTRYDGVGDGEPHRRTIARGPARSDGDGLFSRTLRVSVDDATPLSVHAEFNGTRYQEGVQVRLPLDSTRANVSLRVALPAGNTIVLSKGGSTQIDVTATSDPPGIPFAGLPITIDDELGNRVADATLDDSGHCSISVPNNHLGSPGPGRLNVRSSRTDAALESLTEVPIVKQRQTLLSLERIISGGGEDPFYRATLTDGTNPLVGRAVGLFLNEGRIGTGHLSTKLSDSHGQVTYRAEDMALVATTKPSGSARLVAKFDSADPGYRSSISAPMEMNSTHANLKWFAMAGVALLLALGFWFTRSRQDPQSAAPAFVEQRAPGVYGSGRRGVIPTVRRVAGRAVDVHTGRPMESVRVSLIADGGGAETPPTRKERTTTKEGAFEFASVPEGDWTLILEHGDYSPISMAIHVPHRGQWSQLTARLLSLRAQVLAPFKSAADRSLPRSALWDVWTNREIGGRDGDGSRMHEYARWVDARYYGAEAPSTDDVEHSQRLAADRNEALRAENHK